MCCAFNMNAADQIFQSSTYLKLVLEKQQENNYLSFTDFTIPDSFKNDEKKAMPGMNKGLTIVNITLCAYVMEHSNRQFDREYLVCIFSPYVSSLNLHFLSFGDKFLIAS